MRALRARRQLRATGLKAALGILAGVGLLWGLFALSTADGGDRMSPFGEAPSSVHDDLLYLTCIDSLARDDRAVPTGVVEEELLAQQLVLLSGTPRRTAEAWGLFPRSEEGQGPLNELFRELNRGGRIILPLYGTALGTHLKERRLHPGYLVFGQTARAGPKEADFCGVLTAVNSIQPEFTALIYRDPDTGRLVHGSYEDMPDFGYLGGGRLGDDIPAVYREYFQHRAPRGRKALYK